MNFTKRTEDRLRLVLSYSGFSKKEFILKMMISSIFAFPVVTILRLINLKKPIFITKIRADRLGHFIGHPILCYERVKRVNAIGLYWLDNKPCNEFWLDFLERHIIINPLIKYLDLWNRLTNLGHAMEDFYPTYIWDTKILCDPTMRIAMPFSSGDDARGWAWLEENGWSHGQQIVCIHLRDEKFLELSDPSVDWSVHQKRDTDVSSIRSAIEWLVERNIFVIRMGKVAKHRVSFQSNNFLDLPFSTSRNDFIDIWLWSVCDMGITSTSGPHLVMNFFNPNWLCIDQYPIGSLVSCAPGIMAPKPRVDMTGNPISVFAGFFDEPDERFDSIEKFHYPIRNLSQDEMKKIVIEAWERFQGDWSVPSDYWLLESKFLELLDSYCKKRPIVTNGFGIEEKPGSLRNGYFHLSYYYLKSLSGLTSNKK